MKKHKKLTPFATRLLLALAVVILGITATANCQVVQTSLLLQKTPPQGGMVTPNVGVHGFEQSSEVVLTATPKPGYHFVYWMGDVADPTANTTTAYLDGPKIIIAVFERSEFEFEFPTIEASQSTPVGGMRASAADYARTGGGGGGGKRPNKPNWPHYEPEEPEPDVLPVPNSDDLNKPFPIPASNPEPATGLLFVTATFLAARFRPRKEAASKATRTLVLAFALCLCLFSNTSLRADAPNVVLETTHGDIIIELYDVEAPNTVDNFLTYVKDGFYDGLIFHRVIITPNPFMIQAGLTPELTDPCGIRDPIENEFNISNTRATVAMAKVGGDPDSATSEFFINLDNNTFLDTQNGGFTVFGYVNDMTVVDLIAQVSTHDIGGMEGVPDYPVIIYRARIVGDLDDDYFVKFNDYTILANQWLDTENQTKITDPAPAVEAEFGYSVAISDQYAVAGAPGDVPNGNDAGHAAIINFDDGSSFSFDGNDTTTGDWFGFAVDIDANIVVVSAIGDNSETGSVYLFQCNDTNYNEITKFSAPDSAAGDWFGYSLAIDANNIIVGAVGNDQGASNAGAAYIFNAAEQSLRKLTAFDAAENDKFGYAVDISGDYAIIGATRDDDNGSSSGSVYIYKRSGLEWLHQIKITTSEAAPDDWFGYSVAIDGEYAAVGAIYDDNANSNSGAVYILKRTDDVWALHSTILAFDGAALDRFGYSVSIDGDLCVISAVRDDDSANDAGSIYLYKYDGVNWAYQNKFTADDADDSDYLGHSVRINNGNIITGAIGDDDNGDKAGSVYLFDLCPEADMNGDCVVDYNDLALLASNWLKD